MKKIKSRFAIIALTTMMLFTACDSTGSITKESSNNSQTSEATDEPKEETFKQGETAVFENLKITVNSIETSKGSEYNTPKDGNVFVGIKITVENISDEEENISSMLLFDAYADDVKTDLSISAGMEFDEGTLDGALSPGKKLIGYYGLEVPSNTAKIDLEVKSSWLSDSKATFELTVPA